MIRINGCLRVMWASLALWTFVVIGPGLAMADPVGLGASGGGGPPTVIPYFASPTGVDHALVEIGPVVVSHDPAAGPWIKELHLPPTTLPPGTPYSVALHEHLIVGPPTPWTDWHEIIMTPGWVWSDVTLIVGGVILPPSMVTPTELWWDFLPPLVPGTPVDIFKVLKWVGGADGVTPRSDLIVIKEYPTVPLPMGALMAAPVVLLAGLSWRKRRVA